MTITSSFIHPDFEQTGSSKGISSVWWYQQCTGAHRISHASAFPKLWLFQCSL